MAITIVIDQFLPLAYHSEYLVIDYNHFYWNVVNGTNSKLLSTHLHTTITVNGNNESVWMCHLCTDRCRETKSHCAKATRSDPGTRLVELVILSSPHLVLTNVSRYDSFAVGCIIQQFNNPLRLKYCI
ncbi:hypothetical protein D3C81_1719960 [compost metagenome]